MHFVTAMLLSKADENELKFMQSLLNVCYPLYQVNNANKTPLETLFLPGDIRNKTFMTCFKMYAKAGFDIAYSPCKHLVKYGH